MEPNLLLKAFVLLGISVLLVPLAKKLGVGSVLGYLFAGILIGPFAFNLVGDSHGVMMHVSELGVVLMLFVIGLELEPKKLWNLRAPILGLGGIQVVLTTLIIGALSYFFLPFSWTQSLALGMVMSLSSTAIVLQSLQEKGILKSAGGQAAFSVLLFQDIAVIPMLAILPLLAQNAPQTAIPSTSHSTQALMIIAAIAAVILIGKFLMQPLFKLVALARIRETFTAMALMIVVGAAGLMQSVNLSPALGAFLAGVVLADSEYRHQLEADIEPFKGLLLGLFFLSVGASFDFNLIIKFPLLILLLAFLLMIFKFVILGGVAKISKMNNQSTYLLAFSLCQGGEFAFVLLSQLSSLSLLNVEQTKIATAVVALSMALAPLALVFCYRLLNNSTASNSNSEQPNKADISHNQQPVIIAGFGRVGGIVGRLLRANSIPVSVLDYDANQIDLLRKFGVKANYGDASRLDMLQAAGADHAQILVIAVDDKNKCNEIVELAQKNFPHLKLIVRAVDRPHAFDLLDQQVNSVHRETFSSSIDMGVEVLKTLGYRPNQAHRAGLLFKTYDERSLEALKDHRKDEKKFVFMSRQQFDTLEKVMRNDISDGLTQTDHAWEPVPAKV